MKKHVCSFFLFLFLSAILLSGCTGCQSQELTNEQIQAQARLDPARLLENDIFSVSPQELEKMEGVTEKNSIFSTDVTLYGHPGQVIYFLMVLGNMFAALLISYRFQIRTRQILSKIFERILKYDLAGIMKKPDRLMTPDLKCAIISGRKEI